jgi:hypothetical protein
LRQFHSNPKFVARSEPEHDIRLRFMAYAGSSRYRLVAILSLQGTQQATQR